MLKQFLRRSQHTLSKVLLRKQLESLTTGAFAVQIGAFLQPENADKLKAQLEQTHPPISVVKFDSPKGMFYRVRVGRVSTEAEAQDLATELHAEQGYTTFVVRLDD